jgi:imidazolonepropionase-like amidohydrolase
MRLYKKLILPLSLLLPFLGSNKSAAEQSVLVCEGAKVYPSPTAAPVEDAVLVAMDGKITMVAAKDKSKYEPPASALKLNCGGKVVVAGFWNSHVHFMTGWDNADRTPAPELESHMQEMLSRWGFTTVWDLGSVTANTQALKHRVETGEVPGPKILMAGAIFPKNGRPVYLPPEMQLPEAATPQEAEHLVQQYMSLHLDGIKLFAGAFMGDKPVINMDTTIVKAAVDVAHAEGKPVFAHPQNHTGVDNALAGGVDILAHTIPTEREGFTAHELARMRNQHTALIPTLTLWTTVVPDPAIQEKLVQAGVAELKSHFAQGGTILFGTDVGFIPNYETTQEFEFMSRAMGWRDILASLTTNPSTNFKAKTKGRVEKGMDADLVILDADPSVDVRNLAKVAYTIRAGKIIYQK